MPASADLPPQRRLLLEAKWLAEGTMHNVQHLATCIWQERRKLAKHDAQRAARNTHTHRRY
eukprot:6703553-Alexandrium_andersonii.AAC.1